MNEELKREIIIDNYQKISKLLNKNKLNDYISNFKDKKISERINREVFKNI